MKREEDIGSERCVWGCSSEIWDWLWDFVGTERQFVGARESYDVRIGNGMRAWVCCESLGEREKFPGKNALVTLL